MTLFEIGTRLELKIHIEDSGKDVDVTAQVASQNVGPGMLSGRSGMGLRFLDMDPETELDAVRTWLSGKAMSIYGGSFEIQNNIIAKNILGLPENTQRG